MAVPPQTYPLNSIPYKYTLDKYIIDKYIILLPQEYLEK
jgi:hypothetical protein